MKIFVYGTLKRGHNNWKRFLQGRSQFLYEAKTMQSYGMIDLGGFPVVIQVREGADYAAPVTGEVFEVPGKDTLAMLDRLEAGYRRVEALVINDEGLVEKVHFYLGRYGRGDGARAREDFRHLCTDEGVLTWRGDHADAG